MILCAAVGFEETEHLYKLSLPAGGYADPYLAPNEGVTSSTRVTLHELAVPGGDRFATVYDMGDYVQFEGRFQTIPPAVAPALAALARTIDTRRAGTSPRGERSSSTRTPEMAGSTSSCAPPSRCC